MSADDLRDIVINRLPPDIVGGTVEWQFTPNWDLLNVSEEDLGYVGIGTGRISETRVDELRAELELKFGYLVNNWELIVFGLDNFNYDNLPADVAAAIQLLGVVRVQEPALYQLASMVWPGLAALVAKYDTWRSEQLPLVEQALASGNASMEEQLARAFNREGETAFTVKIGEDVSQNLINEALEGTERENVEPATSLPWELALGASRFAIPPLNISVNSRFKVTNVSGGAIRQRNTPKFNTGHSETVVNVTLYFPNHESIWGFEGEGELDIDFDNDSEEKVDRFLSSLRGLVAAFKYSPFLPLKNQYLNSTFNMTGATLQSMSIQTLEGFPFVLAVNLTLLKFNHKAYLPMIRDFNEAIHWGRYRQYMGRAAEHISTTVGRGFLDASYKKYLNPMEVGAAKSFGTEVFTDDGGSYVLDLGKSEEFKYKNTYSKLQEFNDGRHFQLYFPRNTISDVFAPDIADFRTPTEDNYTDLNQKDMWEELMTGLGFDVIDPLNTDFEYEGVANYARYIRESSPMTDLQKMIEWLDRVQSATADQASKALFDQYVEEYIEIERRKKGSIEQNYEDELRERLQREWYALVFFGFRDTPYIQSLLNGAEVTSTGDIIKEWQVPMEQMQVDWSKVIVNGVSVTMSNNIARLQLQMQDEPVHQHIGGKDTVVNVSMTIIGEEELVSFRRVFDHINGLARLEHAHGVLGFLGIKNVVTALCGVKYVLPLNFEVDTIPGYPHVYSVSMSLVDFDIFQQKREQLDSSQQQRLIDAFGKRNPFLRIKQMWGVFNAYPDFPLSVKDSNGETVGHLDPDFYFRSFQTIDDDLTHWKKSESNRVDDGEPAASGTVPTSQLAGGYGEHGEPPTTAVDEDSSGERAFSEDSPYWSLRVDHSLGDFMDEENLQPMIGVTGDSLELMVVDTETGDIRDHAPGGILEEDLGERTLTQSGNPLLTPYANYSGAYYDSDTLNTLGLDSKAGFNPSSQFEKMMFDAQYRDISGRMIRAFPTYMLWLIDEGGNFAGVKLFDNFYGLQSVIDFSLVRSEDILADTLILNLSNMFSKLTTDEQDFLFYDPDQTAPDGSNSTTNAIDNIRNQYTNALRHTAEQPPAYVQELEHIRLRPGVRLHLRAGYGANPNSLETVFNGVITEVQQGDIVTVVAQSDAVELSPYVNTADKDGHSGKIDGSLNTGFWLSEPRDLIVRLLTMGTSVGKEAISRGTRGTIFSESKFGIKHFGMILYEPMTEMEEKARQARVESASSAFAPGTNISAMQEFLGQGQVADITNGVNSLAGGHQAPGIVDALAVTAGNTFTPGLGTFFQRNGVLDLMTSLWVNSFKERDFEIFKRNIYPGNGTGVMQFAGVDTLDADIYWQNYAPAGLSTEINAEAFSRQQVNQYLNNALNESIRDGDRLLEGEFTEDELVELLGSTQAARLEDLLAARGGKAFQIPTTDVETNSGNPAAVIGTGMVLAGLVNPALGLGVGALGLVAHGISSRSQNPIYQFLGISQTVQDDDLAGFDEVSFRAQTFMRTVWDMFQICADMLPNYIVSVRPFEDRSTVFYGKPHWLYTSGVVPLTSGVPVDNALKFDEPNEEQRKILELFSQVANRRSDASATDEFLAGLGNYSDPYSTSIPTAWAGGDIKSLPLENSAGGKIPLGKRKVIAGIEMHLPTHDGEPSLADNHLRHTYFQQIGSIGGIPELPTYYRYPFYMDRKDGPRGGYAGIYQSREDAETAAEAEGKNFFFDYSVLKGEVGQTPGEPGAFGILDPEEEVYYCNMRWPYSSDSGGIKVEGQTQDMFRHKRLMVFNEDNGRMCICVPGEYGPNVTTGKDMGLSPEAMFYLGGELVNNNFRMRHEKLSNLYIGWVDDNTKPGPVGGYATATTVTNGYVGNRSISDLSPEQIAASDTLIIEIDYSHSEAYEAISELFEKNSERIAFLNESGALYDQRGGRKVLIQDLEQFAYDNFPDDMGTFINLYGWAFEDIHPALDEDRIFGTRAIEHWDDSTGNMLSYRTQALMYESWDREVDSIGGATIYSDRAISIWNQLRTRFSTNGQIRQAYLLHEENEAAFVVWNATRDSDLEDFPAFQKAVAQFLQFMWADPFRRAWVTVVVDRNNNWYDAGSDFFTDRIDYDLDDGFWGTLAGPLDEIALGVVDGTKATGRWIESGWDYVTGSEPDEEFSIGNLLPVWIHFVAPENEGDRDTYISGLADRQEDSEPKTIMDELINQNRSPGSDSTDAWDDTVSDIRNWWDRNVGSVIAAVGDLFSAVITTYRQQMAMMGMNLTNVAQMQMQANVLNRTYNDSIYYSDRYGDSILKMADNPFTREYNEPVVEIREPFQRLHYLSSFQHILSNNISENLNDVNTVMTATSDGKYPVTVYFDKGAPPERQKEGVTETGLFWDNARGSGIFSFLHPILHPMQTLRGTVKNSTGASDETVSKRIALSRLREGLKDIYQGEILIIGDPDIRPHDLIYIGDVYSRIYGMCEVEQIVHHFTPDQGFVSSITPNALVTVNDPARWSMLSYIGGLFGMKDIRDTLRAKYNIVADSSSPIKVGDVTVDALHRSVLEQAHGSRQYTNGNAALLRDLNNHKNMGLMTWPVSSNGPTEEKVNYGQNDLREALGDPTSFTDLVTNLIPGVGMVQKALDWVAENLNDQHGCYIQYLNKDGQPMDAGLSYNQGVAVGQWYSRDVLPGILNIPHRIIVDEHVRITSDDLLGALGWNEVDTHRTIRDVSWWVNQTNRNVLKLSGFGPDPITVGKPSVMMIRVREVIDGDTIAFDYVHEDFDFTRELSSDIQSLSTEDHLRLRFSGIDTQEIKYKFNDDDYKFNEISLGTAAAEYVNLKLVTEPQELGVDPIFAVRIDASSTRDTYERVLGTIFHTVPIGTNIEDRPRVLYDLAREWPINPWDSYHPDGRPYTLNWDLVTKGLANVYLKGIGIGIKNYEDEFEG